MEINISRSSSEDFQKKIYFTKFGCHTNDKVEGIYIYIYYIILHYIIL